MSGISLQTANRNSTVVGQFRAEQEKFSGSKTEPKLLCRRSRLYLVTARSGIIGDISRIWHRFLCFIRYLSDDQTEINRLIEQSTIELQDQLRPDSPTAPTESFSDYQKRLHAYQGETILTDNAAIKISLDGKSLHTFHRKAEVNVNDDMIQLPDLLVVDLHRTFPVKVNGVVVYDPVKKIGTADNDNNDHPVYLSTSLFKKYLPCFNNNPILTLNVLKLTTQVMFFNLMKTLHNRVISTEFLASSRNVKRWHEIDYDDKKHTVALSHHFIYQFDLSKDHFSKVCETGYIRIDITMHADSDDLIKGNFTNMYGEEVYSPFYKTLKEAKA